MRNRNMRVKEKGIDGEGKNRKQKSDSNYASDEKLSNGLVDSLLCPFLFEFN